MRCNACWRELEGPAVATNCRHIFCTEDAAKILSNHGLCPICKTNLTRSLMKPTDTNPNDEWQDMAMVGLPPELSFKAAYSGIMFYLEQREMEMEWKFNRARNLEQKLEEANGAYQKISERCGMLELENEKLSKELLELQEKFSELSRQKRKLHEMNNETVNEIESLYRSAIKRANLSVAHGSALTADIPGPSSHPSFGAGVGSQANSLMSLKDRILGPSYNASRARHNNSNRPFDMSGGSPAKRSVVPMRAERGKGVPSSHPSFGAGVGSRPANPSRRNHSPIKQPQLSRGRGQEFTNLKK